MPKLHDLYINSKNQVFIVEKIYSVGYLLTEIADFKNSIVVNRLELAFGDWTHFEENN
jgi:hypothetical protein